jgi:hypothetical protein
MQTLAVLLSRLAAIRHRTVWLAGGVGHQRIFFRKRNPPVSRSIAFILLTVRIR